LSGERLAAVYRVLATLSEKKRVVFVLHDLQGVPAMEIAKALSTNVLTVRTRLFYARKEFYEGIRLEPSFGEGWQR
jgi:RNA polymerase sigma-70 factor (ECF subfamily)